MDDPISGPASLAISRQEPIELSCPVCGSTWQDACWLIVDAGERPDLHAAILEGRIDQALCPGCGAAGTITAPLLFHDGATKRLLAALPGSVADVAEAQRIVAELRDQLLAALPVSARQPYLGRVELAAEIAGLRVAIAPGQAGDADPLRGALEQIVSAETDEDFRRVLVAQRALLMRPEADLALGQLASDLRAVGEDELARRAADQRALLGRFRTTLLARRQRMAELLDELAPLSAAERAVLEPLRQMLEAVDEQEVFAARLALDPTGQATLDGMVARLQAIASAADDEPAAEYLAAIARLPQRAARGSA